MESVVIKVEAIDDDDDDDVGNGDGANNTKPVKKSAHRNFSSPLISISYHDSSAALDDEFYHF